MTVVSATTTLKFVVACSRVLSQSPVSDCSFLKAIVEDNVCCEPCAGAKSTSPKSDTSSVVSSVALVRAMCRGTDGLRRSAHALRLSHFRSEDHFHSEFHGPAAATENMAIQEIRRGNKRIRRTQRIRVRGR